MRSRTNSLIGYASDNELRIALHYQDAAEILYKSDAYTDGITLPFLFLIRQFLELGKKGDRLLFRLITIKKKGTGYFLG